MSRVTRRELLRAGAAGGAALGVSALGYESLISRALAAAKPCAGASLQDIEHFVILIQENRSFDHYFGAYRGVTGFADKHVLRLHDGSGLTIFAQPGYPGGFRGDHLYPFHINAAANGECTNDIDHSWGPQHAYWDNGKLDQFVSEHLKVDGVNGPLTMGYYKRSDLQFYYALADAFTICDHYHSSVIGPTDPNRLYTISAWLDPAGKQGGPILSTSTTRVERYGTLSWTTMPEQLEARGISWKIYASADGNFGDNVLPYFRQYQTNPTLAAKAIGPSYPGEFQADVAAGTLPQVSWILAPLVNSEHPPAPPEYGELIVANVLSTLVSNHAVWSKTALLVTYDENGGFFDHVPPPVAPGGTQGEYLTVNPLPADASGVSGPIGLGFRVPMLVVSPFSRGGFVCSDVFDHTSTLRLLEARFGAEVPNLTAWRRSITGDMTTAFNFAKVETSVPSLPQPSATDPRVINSTCRNPADIPPYPVTVNSAPPAQEAGSARAPSGPVCGAAAARLTARGVRARTNGTFSGTIATFSYTDVHARASDFRVRISWGDGHVTHGTVVGRGGKFRVHARHHFARAGSHHVQVHVRAPDDATATASSTVKVVHRRARPRPQFTG
jgi:phospholipase C